MTGFESGNILLKVQCLLRIHFNSDLKNEISNILTDTGLEVKVVEKSGTALHLNKFLQLFSFLL